MSSFMNKISNTVTNKGGMILGRGNLTKLTNSINQTLFKAKYREFLKVGNTIQLVSKNSHMSLQICSSMNDPGRLVLMGNGQIGPEFGNAHFVIETTPSGHLKFRNHLNYLAFDQEIPCILSEPTKAKPKNHEMIRARNEFRLHEIIGSDEYFALESVYFPGRYLSILPDGSITVSRDKTQESTLFFLHVVHVMTQNGRPDSTISSGRPESVIITPGASSTVITPVPGVTIITSSSGGANGYTPNNLAAREKERESQQVHDSDINAGASSSSAQANEAPPTYTNLFPQLPK